MNFLDDINPRNLGGIAAALFVAAMVMAGVAGGFVSIFLLGAALYLMARLYDQSQRNNQNQPPMRRSASREESEYNVRRDRVSAPRQRQRPVQQDAVVRTSDSNAEPIYKHALQAVKAVGHDLDSMTVLPVDIGLLAFHDNDAPKMCRSFPVPDSTDYIQPFVQLRLPQKAIGKIRFEVLDSDGQMLYVHEVQQTLNKGRNLVSPPSRLRLHSGHNLRGKWEMRVYGDGVELANHRFEWEEDEFDVIREHLSADGEISDQMRDVLAQNSLDSVSLDDLLAPQESVARSAKK